MDETHVEVDGSAAVATAEVDVDAIVQALDTEFHVLPEAAIREAQRHREQVTPALIEVIRQGTEIVRAGESLGTNGTLFALYLLWEFKAQKAWPAIQEAFALPGEGLRELFGETDEYLAPIIATLAADPMSAAAELVDSRELDGFLRWNAATTYLQLVKDGKLSRDEASHCLTQHLRQSIDTNDNDIIVTGLVMCLADLGATEAMPEIERAFEKNAVDEFMTTLPIVHEQMSANGATDQWLTCRHPSELKDTYEELRTWAGFQPQRSTQADDSRHWNRPSATDDYLDEEPEYAAEPATIRYDDARVGRNDPCPCGSGRKFKKCCGSRSQSQIDI
jgi:uncharacterized protein YecA (UPF0149 family)